jgi:thiol-disulfide isomerase/thioredoxin
MTKLLACILLSLSVAPALHSEDAPAPQDKTPQTTAPAPQKKMWARSVLGQKAPEFLVEKWLTAEPDTKGKFVLIDFWATWCGPCRKAIPELNKFQKQFADKLVVIGISDEKEEAVRKMTSPAIEYATAIDTQARMKNELKVEGIPHVIVIDPQGIVRWEGFPFLKGFELTEDVMKEILAK